MMFRKLLTFGAIVMVLLISNSSFASRSRVGVLGNGDPLGMLSRGSFYVDDNMNIFDNPAYVNDFKNWAAVERNNGTASTVGEGGFVANFMNWNFGFYGNRGDAVTATSSGFNNISRFKTMDILLGSEMSNAKFGISATLSNYNNSGNRTNGIDNTLHAGASMSGFDVYASFKVQGKESIALNNGSTDTYKSAGYSFGGKYHWGEWVPYVATRSIDNTNAGGTHSKRMSYGLGLGRNMKMSEGTHMDYATGIFRDSKLGRNVVPVEISVEHDLTTWLTARAGFYYGLYSRTANTTDTNDTAGRLGASIKIGRASFDWTVGGGAAAGATYGSDTSTAFDFSNGFFSAASLTYLW